MPAKLIDEKTFYVAMKILKLQADAMICLEKENDDMRIAIQECVKFLDGRGYRLSARAFKKLRLVIKEYAI